MTGREIERRSGPPSATFDRRTLRAAGPDAPRRLDHVIDGLRSMLARAAGDGVELLFDLRATGAVGSPPDEVERLLGALVSEARGALPSGGRVSIATRDVEVPAGAEQAAAPPGRWVELLVRDAGLAARSPEGPMRVVHARGGVVAVDTSSEGTTVRLLLPRIEPAVAPGQLGALLLAEATPGDAARALREAGHRVVVAQDGVEALEAAERTDVDLLVLDVELPRLGGIEVARRLSVDRPWLRVLFLGDRVQGDVLPRPFSPDALLARVGQLVACARRARPARPGPCLPEHSTDADTTVRRIRATCIKSRE